MEAAYQQESQFRWEAQYYHPDLTLYWVKPKAIHFLGNSQQIIHLKYLQKKTRTEI